MTTSLSVCFYFLLFLIMGNLTMGVSWSSPQTYVKDCWSSHSPCLMLSANAGSGMAFFKKLSMDFRRAALCGKHCRPRGRIKIKFSFTCVQELLTELVQYLEGKPDRSTLTKTNCHSKMALPAKMKNVRPLRHQFRRNVLCYQQNVCFIFLPRHQHLPTDNLTFCVQFISSFHIPDTCISVLFVIKPNQKTCCLQYIFYS